jgi:hypothetical protein
MTNMANQIYRNPEPVPPASQLAVLPFLAAVDGYLRSAATERGLRITLHRAMSREGHGYLQQLCGYVDDQGLEWKGKVGRTFPLNEGIIGAAYGDGHIWRTKSFPSRDELMAKLRKELKGKADPEDFEISYLAIPFLGPSSDPVLVLYGTSFELNFFADDERIRQPVLMCNCFCKLFDYLQRENFPNLRNFPLPRGNPTQGNRPVFMSIQEQLKNVNPPKFKNLTSFNYEAAVA